MRATVAVAGLLVLSTLICLGQNHDTSNSGNERQVTVVEFADFQCPFCARQATDLRRLQMEYSGKVTLVFRNFPLSFHKQSKAAHLAALAAARQGKFWEMHDLIFADQQHLSPEYFDRYATQLGLRMEDFQHAIADPAELDVIDKDIAEGKALGITATPTFVINGHQLVGRQSYAKLKQIIEAEINSEPWPNAEGVHIDIANAPSRGPESGTVTIEEYADFQCPFCAAAVGPLHRLLDANPGKVRLVFKNFPLNSHADSQLAHRAALAAREQGKFWEMHDLIYAHQHTLKHDNLLGFAEQLHLDMARFQKDLDSPQLEARIDADKNEGEQIGVSATPTFIVNGEAISGFSAVKLQARIDAQNPGEEKQPIDIVTEIPAENLSLGPKDARLKIDWYVDLTSPLTAESAARLNKFLAAHQGEASVEFRNFPLPTHPAAMLVHEFVLAAAAQGKFWQIESLLLADPKPKDRNELESIASQAQLDQKALWADVDMHKYAPLITRDVAAAKRRGVSGTPTFFVSNKKLDGINGLAALQ